MHHALGSCLSVTAHLKLQCCAWAFSFKENAKEVPTAVRYMGQAAEACHAITFSVIAGGTTGMKLSDPLFPSYY